MFIPFLRLLQGGESDDSGTNDSANAGSTDDQTQTDDDQTTDGSDDDQKTEQDDSKAAAEKAKTEEFFQTKYQHLLAHVTQKAPDVAESFKKEPAPTTSIKHADVDEEATRTVADMTENELFNRLGDVITKRTEAAMGKARNDAIVHQQSSVAVQTAQEYAQEVGLSDEEQKRAFEEAESLGIDIRVPNGPISFGRALMKEMRLIALTKSSGQRVDAATRNASEEARRAALTQQPPKGGPSTPKAPTDEMKKLEKMYNTQPGSSLNLLDSARKGG